MALSRPLVGALAAAGFVAVAGAFILLDRGPVPSRVSAMRRARLLHRKRRYLGLEGLGASSRRQGVDLEEIWGDTGEAEAARGRAFRWLSRVGAAPRFGSRPIGWYQEQMVSAIDVLKERAALQVRAPRYFKVQGGVFYARSAEGDRWKNIRITPSGVYDLADRKVRAG